MDGRVDTVRTMQKYLDTMRSWFSRPRSDDEYTAIHGDDGDFFSELPFDEHKRAPPERGCLAGLRPTPKHASDFFWAILPSFLARAFWHVDENAVIPAATKTSYLNGLRGVASMIVVFQHNTDDYLFVHHGWGETIYDRYLFQLPFIRLIHCGSFMVCIFFVLSGFVLTYGPLKKCHNGRSTDAIASLPSSIFRRPLRLFIPVVPVLMGTCLLIQFQVFYRGSDGMPMPNGINTLWGWAHFIWSTLLVITASSSIDTIMPQGWTLAAEYQGSLLVFLSCIAFARVSPKVRMSFVFLVLIFMFNLGLWQECLFLAGMILADIRHIRETLPDLTKRARTVVTVASWVIFVFALFLGGWPTHGNGYKAAGYSWFAWVPTGVMETQHFFLFFAAVGLVVSLENLPVLQRGLDSRFILYLGEISFSLYLVHWAIGRCWLTWGLKYRLLLAGETLAVASFVSFVITLLLSVWLADVHWRLVDKKTVKFSQWLSRKIGI